MDLWAISHPPPTIFANSPPLFCFILFMINQMGDDSSSSSSSSSSCFSSYIRLVQHLIEKCLLSYMTKEECMEALSTHANIKPVITSTVWKELEKENKGFFEAYWRNKEDYTRGNDTTKMMMTMNMHSNSSSTKESQD